MVVGLVENIDSFSALPAAQIVKYKLNSSSRGSWGMELQGFKKMRTIYRIR